MAHLHGTASDDSDTTTFSLSYDSDKHILDLSPTTSDFPDKPSLGRKEEILDPRCPPVIPPIGPKHPNRTLVLCFDGTGDQFDADNSNIVQLVSLLKKDDSKNQLVYYQVRFFQKNQFICLLCADIALCIFFLKKRLVLARMTPAEIRQPLFPQFARYFSLVLRLFLLYLYFFYSDSR
jgi:hypothetical protein